MPGARTQNYSVKSRVVNLKMCDCKVGKEKLCRRQLWAKARAAIAPRIPAWGTRGWQGKATPSRYPLAIRLGYSQDGRAKPPAAVSEGTRCQHSFRRNCHPCLQPSANNLFCNVTHFGLQNRA